MRKSAKTIRTAVRMVFALSEEQLQAFRSAARFLAADIRQSCSHAIPDYARVIFLKVFLPRRTITPFLTSSWVRTAATSVTFSSPTVTPPCWIARRASY